MKTPIIAASLVVLIAVTTSSLHAQQPANLALVATAATSFVSGHETILALNDGFKPRNSDDKRHGAYGNWPEKGTQWVEYAWSQSVHIGGIEVFWFDDHRGVRLPKTCRLKYFDGKQFVEVKNAKGLGLKENQFNETTFYPVWTNKLRLEMDSSGESTGILEWRVLDAGDSPRFPPRVNAGIDRAVVMPGTTWLSGNVRFGTADRKKADASQNLMWTKVSGPGAVTFVNGTSADTGAEFSQVGYYVLQLTAIDGKLRGADTLRVHVVAGPPTDHLEPVATMPYKITGPLLRERFKQTIIHWIPHCYEKLSDPKLPEGGIENFAEAGKMLAGKTHEGHRGAPWANAYTHNTVESMCLALMVDPQGDADIKAAQDAIRKKLNDWIPKILSAQEADGYMQTFYTLGGMKRWTNKSDHEGYTAGYFIESALAHYAMTDKKDDRMYRAARKVADCWYDNIGPSPKRKWYDGHEELEQALVRLGKFVDAEEGAGKGRKYIELAKFLLDSRGGGEAYDQSHVSVTRQYEAVGHSVRAAYCYSGMAAVAMETGDVNYQSALLSIWENLINKRYYATGGIGSGETSEGFGPNYSLPNNAYCESCSNCGELFFQHKMNAIYRRGEFVDLYEDTFYNSILSDLDLQGQNFTYTNALDTSEKRYKWHGCPCCVGNIPRTLLMLPTWMYATAKDGLYVNLYAGSTVKVDNVAGTSLEIEQSTDYPWSGKVSLVVRPAKEKEFTIRLRVPNREVSLLYETTPKVADLKSLGINGTSVTPSISAGYVTLHRTWKSGDRIELELPLVPQRIKAIDKVSADRGRVALRYGPLVYNIESVDQNVEKVLSPDSALTTEWKSDLLGGVVVIRGKFTDGTPMMAIPNFARNNRGGRSLVWMRDK